MSDAQISAEASEVLRRPSRLRALADWGANAESSAESLDRIARVACRVLDVPVALVNLVGEDRQRFVGCGGPEPWASMAGMPLTAGFCPFALSVERAYTLDDARVDPASAVNPAVERFGVVAYAGVPLRAADAEPIGTFCALDTKPRRWNDDDLALLSDLAEGVMAELQLLAATRQLARDQVRLRALTAFSSALTPGQRVGDVVDELTRSVERVEANAVWVSMVDESGQTLHTAAASGGASADAARRSDLAFAAPLSPAEVTRTGGPEFLTSRADVRDRFDRPEEAMSDVGSVAVLPLTAGDQVFGVLGVSFADERALTAADRQYLAALSGITALALAH